LKEGTFHNITSPLRSGFPHPSVPPIFGLPVVKVCVIVVVVFSCGQVFALALESFLLTLLILVSECSKLLEDLGEIQVGKYFLSHLCVDIFDPLDGGYVVVGQRVTICGVNVSQAIEGVLVNSDRAVGLATLLLG
jgi:hypothetical protein